MKHFFSAVVAVLLATLIGCSTNPLSSNEPSVGSTDFYVTGKITNNDGSPIKGAVARLTKSGLSAITDANGNYTITGKASTHGLKKAYLAKTAALLDAEVTDGYSDTLSVKVVNEHGDSSEIVKSVVTSGVVMDLPTTYILARSITVPYYVVDGTKIGKIEAIVYDTDVPEIKKTIELANDTMQKKFTTYAYFTSEDKSYILYTLVYDENNRFIGRSNDYPFTNKYGPLEYSSPFNVINAKPVITIDGPDSVVMSTNVTINITAVDSFGGSITKCEIAMDNESYKDIATFKASLAKRSVFGQMINESINISMPNKDTTLIASIKVTDDDGNTATKNYTLKVKPPKVVVSGQEEHKYGYFNKIGDTVTLQLENYSCSEPSLTVTKVEWIIMDQPNSIKNTSYKVDSSAVWTSGNAADNGKVRLVYNVIPNDDGSQIRKVDSNQYKMNFYTIFIRVTLSNGYSKIGSIVPLIAIEDLGPIN
jgi:hypothetical protein